MVFYIVNKESIRTILTRQILLFVAYSMVWASGERSAKKPTTDKKDKGRVTSLHGLGKVPPLEEAQQPSPSIHLNPARIGL